MKANFLLINGSREHYWLRVLEEALTPLGTLRVGTEDDATRLVLQEHYDIIVVDATSVEDAPLLVSRIRTQRPDAKIVVVTASPTWRRARAAFQAGAMDYIRKSMNTEDLHSAFEEILTWTPRS